LVNSDSVNLIFFIIYNVYYKYSIFQKISQNLFFTYREHFKTKGPFYRNFFQDFLEGIIPPSDPKKPLYKGGYGRGYPIGRGIGGGSRGC